jgi:peroxiredoxin
MTTRHTPEDPFPMDPRAFGAGTRGWTPLLALLLVIAVALLVACAAKELQKTSGGHGEALGTGDTAPDFTLPDAYGRKVTLSQIKKPTLIIFYLGYDCPRCVRHLREIAAHKDEFDKLNVQVLAISPDPVEKSRISIRDFGGFPFPLLSDPDKKVAASYGVLLGQDVLFHGVYVLDAGRQIQFSLRSDHPYDNTQKLIDEFKEMSKKD